MKTDKIPIEKFWRIVAQDHSDEPTAFDLMIFSTMGDPFSDDAVWAKQFTEELWKLPRSVKRLNIHINSPGGSVAEAQAIYSALADHKSEKHVFIDGLAASAATIPAMAAHRIFIRANATMMIHLPYALCVGNSNAMRDTISMLEATTDGIINVYAKKTGLDRDKIRALMEKETWFTANEAVASGFCDEVRGVIKAAAIANSSRVIFNGQEFNLAPFEYKRTPAFPETIDMKKTQPFAADTSPPPERPKSEPPPVAPSKSDEPEVGKPEPTHPAEPKPAEPKPEERETADQVATMRLENPKACQAIFNEGVQAERTRQAAFARFGNDSCAAIVAAAIADGRSANDIAAECYDAAVAALEAEKKQRSRHADAGILDGVRADSAPFLAPSSHVKPPSGNADISKGIADMINRGRLDKKGTR